METKCSLPYKQQPPTKSYLNSIKCLTYPLIYFWRYSPRSVEFSNVASSCRDLQLKVVLYNPLKPESYLMHGQVFNTEISYILPTQWNLIAEIAGGKEAEGVW